MTPPRSPGRPRSERARRAVLEAARELVGEIGYESATIDAIATRAGVSRQTIYRWWPAKSAIVAEAVVEGMFVGLLPDPSADPVPDGTAVERLRAWLDASVRLHADPEHAALIRALAAAAASDADQSHALYAAATRPAYDHLVTLLDAILTETGTSMPLPSDAIADAMLGTLLYRVLARAPIPVDLPRTLLTMAGLTPDDRRRSP